MLCVHWPGTIRMLLAVPVMTTGRDITFPALLSTPRDLARQDYSLPDNRYLKYI